MAYTPLYDYISQLEARSLALGVDAYSLTVNNKRIYALFFGFLIKCFFLKTHFIINYANFHHLMSPMNRRKILLVSSHDGFFNFRNTSRSQFMLALIIIFATAILAPRNQYRQ